MLHVDEVELYKEPRKEIQGIFGEIPGEPEMTENESAFLCGLLKKYRPRTIVEVGIAGGGTSAIILSCMKLLKMYDSMLFSIDYSERFYRDKNFKSGHLGIKAGEMLGMGNNHVVLLGDIACNFSDIKGEIEFLIIDTMHTAPGELLDYIALLPCLKKNAVIVFHDIALPYAYEKHREANVMGILFACATGDKYFNTFDFEGTYSNIGAIQITDETIKDIEKVFLSLLIPWEYIPERKQIDGYRKCIADCYEARLLDLFDKAVKLNTAHPKKEIRTKWLFPFGKVEKKSGVVLFGAGDVGREFAKQISHTNYCSVIAVVDNDVKKQVDGILPPSKLNALSFDYVVIAIEQENAAKQILKQLQDMGIESKKIVWREYGMDMDRDIGSHYSCSRMENTVGV